MPAFAGQLFGSCTETVLVKFAVLLARNNRDFIVQLAVLINGDVALAVAECMLVELAWDQCGPYEIVVCRHTFEVAGFPVSSPNFCPRIF